MREKFPITGILNFLEKEEDFVFLETARMDAENFLSYIFVRPQRVISTFRIEQVQNCLARLSQALTQGYYVAGFLAYEAGEAFEEKLKDKQAYKFPLLWLGVYKAPLIFNHRRENFARRSLKCPELIARIKDCAQAEGASSLHPHYILKNIRPNITQKTYLGAIARIKRWIARGFTYQVNYTFKLKFSFSGSPAGLYLALRDKQRVPYSAFIKAGRYFILSFSPELFFRKRAQAILARPMKGTARRGKNLAEDSLIAEQLGNCCKNRSENVMIVDLLRNDLGRISATASVQVPRLFNVERYETLFQMTSDIQSRLKPHCSALDIFSHIFPSGSVTGAPKIRTMQIIQQLEKEPRNVYTGSIGFFAPDKSATFNVAIRTLLIDSQAKRGEMGVGSGIVYDSDPEKEYAECCLKANFLTKRQKSFCLLETMLWQPAGGYLFLDEHLQRLEASAKYFDFRFKKEEILKALDRLKKGFGANSWRVRLLLDREGELKLEPSIYKLTVEERPRVCLSLVRTYSQDPFLYHKTTNRHLYDEEYRRYRRKGFYEVIFANEKGEITEGAISNIFIRKNGKLYTPPVCCGLLDGIYRRYLLNSSRYPVQEKILSPEDLTGAEEIYLSNSVRGLVQVHFQPP